MQRELNSVPFFVEHIQVVIQLLRRVCRGLEARLDGVRVSLSPMKRGRRVLMHDRIRLLQRFRGLFHKRFHAMLLRSLIVLELAQGDLHLVRHSGHAQRWEASGEGGQGIT